MRFACFAMGGQMGTLGTLMSLHPVLQQAGMLIGANTVGHMFCLSVSR